MHHVKQPSDDSGKVGKLHKRKLQTNGTQETNQDRCSESELAIQRPQKLCLALDDDAESSQSLLLFVSRKAHSPPVLEASSARNDKEVVAALCAVHDCISLLPPLVTQKREPRAIRARC